LENGIIFREVAVYGTYADSHIYLLKLFHTINKVTMASRQLISEKWI